MNQRNNSTCDFQVISFIDQNNKSSYSPITSSHSTHPTCTPLVRLHHHVKSENQSVSISRRITSSGETPAQQSPKKNVKVLGYLRRGVEVDEVSASRSNRVHFLFWFFFGSSCVSKTSSRRSHVNFLKGFRLRRGSAGGSRTERKKGARDLVSVL